ncbi:MAG: transcriptional repressor [Alphaproteobacteria bacterium]|nr:transcriptional repressor [Alphaproteobacteria bacterium]
MTHDHGDPKLTRNQQLVFDALDAADGPLSAYTILDRLRDEGFRAPLQVYRALDKLVAHGLVHRIESLNAFVSCDHPAGQSHGTVAFAICEDCGNVTEFAEQDVVKRLQDWARDEGFEAGSTVIELRGLCGNCRAA